MSTPVSPIRSPGNGMISYVLVTPRMTTGVLYEPKFGSFMPFRLPPYGLAGAAIERGEEGRVAGTLVDDQQVLVEHRALRCQICAGPDRVLGATLMAGQIACQDAGRSKVGVTAVPSVTGEPEQGGFCL